MPGPAPSLVERSGALTAGGVAQNALPANQARRYLLIQNPSTAAGQGIAAAESLFVRFEGSAGVNDGSSFELLPGGSIEISSRGAREAVSVNATTISHRWIAIEG